MEIISASLAELADTFLHPGYMSAYAEVTLPGEMTAAAIPVDREPIVQLDMAQALRLTPAMHEAVGAETAPSPQGSEPNTPPTPWVAILAIGLLLGHRRRLAGPQGFHAPRGASLLPLRRLRFALGAVALLAAVACGKGPAPPGGEPPLAAEPSPAAPAGSAPAAADPRVPFENPRAATVAILNGIVADAVACSPVARLESLAAVQSEVGLPITHKTTGMRWAIANYSDDGWARPFRLRALGSDRYEVRSAAEDGHFDTADDIALEVSRAGQQLDWGRKLRAFYLRRERDDAGVSFHRCGRATPRRVAVQSTARGLTSDALFGVVREQEFGEAKRAALRARIERVSGHRDRDALVLAVFDPTHIGHIAPRTELVYVP